MDLKQFLLIMILFCFIAFLFPKMNDEINAISAGEALRPLYLSVPYVFLGVFISCLVYYSFKKKG